jgi:F1F0 ATPase subunit 2
MMKTLHDWITLLPAFGVGVLLGLFFFGGLWLTVTYATVSRYAGLWFFFSIILRTAVVLAGFYFVAVGSFPRMIACLVGFIIARFFTARMLKSPAGRVFRNKKEHHDRS